MDLLSARVSYMSHASADYSIFSAMPPSTFKETAANSKTGARNNEARCHADFDIGGERRKQAVSLSSCLAQELEVYQVAKEVSAFQKVEAQNNCKGGRKKKS